MGHTEKKGVKKERRNGSGHSGDVPVTYADTSGFGA